MNSSGLNYVWYMDGVTFAGGVFLPAITDTKWEIEGVGDFNVDGKVDIMWRHYGTGANYIWYLDGVTVTGAESLSPETGLFWRIENH